MDDRILARYATVAFQSSVPLCRGWNKSSRGPALQTWLSIRSLESVVYLLKLKVNEINSCGTTRSAMYESRCMTRVFEEHIETGIGIYIYGVFKAFGPTGKKPYSRGPENKPSQISEEHYVYRF